MKKKRMLIAAMGAGLLLSACEPNSMVGSGAEVRTTVSEESQQTREDDLREVKVTYETIPDNYRTSANEQGWIESIIYQTEHGEKEAYVYLPFGYDGNDETVRYDVVYMMHGGGGSAAEFLGSPENPNYVKNAVDHLIENGEIEPVIIVTPTFYPQGDRDISVTNADRLTKQFPQEFINNLMPAVESSYHTYAESTSTEDLQASREHRAFGGFSMGSVTTWYMFIDALEYVSMFIPESGDCWAAEQMGGSASTEETVDILKEAAVSRGLSSADFTIYAATGTQDIAYSQLNPQIMAMKKDTEIFKYSETKGNGNLYYNLAEGLTHDYGPMRDYFFDALKFLYH